VKRPFVIVGLLLLIAGAAFGGWAYGRLSAFHTSSGPATCSEAEKLRWIEHANVQEDFRQHVERDHDMRFVAVFGLSFSTEFPGLEDTPEMQQLVQQSGARHLEGMTDVISCEEQQYLSERVFRYAMRYNSMILGYREWHQ
jgi:hypothetical protein